MTKRTTDRNWWLLAARIGALAAIVLASAAACQPGPPTAGTSGSVASDSIPAGPVLDVVGTVTAGPTCPVQRSPEPSECLPRPVAGAEIVASNSQGEAARATTAADGTYRLTIHGSGLYAVSALRLPEYPRAPQPVTVSVGPAQTVTVDFTYDTGIR